MTDIKLDHKEQEIARLHAEIERLTADRDEWIEHLEADNARLTAERANRYWEGRYRDEAKENEKLREQLRAVLLHVAEVRAENERMETK